MRVVQRNPGRAVPAGKRRAGTMPATKSRASSFAASTGPRSHAAFPPGKAGVARLDSNLGKAKPTA